MGVGVGECVNWHERLMEKERKEKKSKRRKAKAEAKANGPEDRYEGE